MQGNFQFQGIDPFRRMIAVIATIFSFFFLAIALMVFWFLSQSGEFPTLILYVFAGVILLDGVAMGIFLRRFWVVRPVFLGSRRSPRNRDRVRGLSVTVERALELAAPHLEESFRLRQQMRSRPSAAGYMALEPEDYITLVGGRYYYICRDNYPYKVQNGFVYLKHAVVVDGQTGEVHPPIG